MKRLLGASAILLTSGLTQAKTLRCWNVYSKFSNHPAVTAEVLADDRLKNIFVEDMVYASTKLNPSLIGPVRGREVMKDPIFQGKNEFKLKFKSRLILPPKIDSESLKSVRFNEKTFKKNNGLLILAELGQRGSLKSEKIVRLFCEINEDR